MSGSAYTIHPTEDTTPARDVHGNSGGLSVTPTWFLTPVLDNAAPRTLQPFLQRTSTVDATLSGGGFVTRYGNGNFTRKASNVSASADVNAYLTPSFALTGGLGYTYDVLHDGYVSKTHVFSGHAGAGVRIGDVRLDASYSFAAHDKDGSFTKLRWGSAGLAAYGIFAQAFTVGLSGFVSAVGGGGAATVGYFPAKDLGILAGGSGRAYVYESSDERAISYGGWAGVTYWPTSDIRLYATYSLTFIDVPAQPTTAVPTHETDNSLSASALLRFY